MVYWKLNRRYQVGTDIWEPRTSVKHFSSLSWCISWPQDEDTISNPTLKLHLLRTALRRGHPSFFVLSSVQWQVLQTATKYCFGLIWCCCFTEEDIVLQNIEDLALAASTKTPDSWQHVYRWRGRPDRSFSQSLAHRLNSLLVSWWTEMHRLHIKYDPMSAFSACVNPKTANMNNQQFTENSFIAIYHSNGLYHRLLRPRIHTRHKWLVSRHT